MRSLILLLLLGVETGIGLGAEVLGAEPSFPSYPAPRFSLNDIDVIYDQKCLEIMEDLIRSAEKSIRLDFYIFAGQPGKHLANLLIEKKRMGVLVRVMLDRHLGTIPSMVKEALPVVKQLRAAKIPVAVIRDSAMDHNKYMVIDGREALVGSTNVGTPFLRFHDLMMRVRGRVVSDLSRQFDFDWYHANHQKVKEKVVPVSLTPLGDVRIPGAEGPGLARLVGTGLSRKTGLESLLPLLATARKSIHVQMHELSDERALQGLIAAHERGVDVRVMLDPGKVEQFIPLVHWAPETVANASGLKSLLDAKVNVRFYHVTRDFTTAHMKSAVIDGNILYAGSINWAKGGFETIAETNLEIRGGRAPAQAEEMFQEDWNHHSEQASQPSSISLYLCELYHLVR